MEPTRRAKPGARGSQMGNVNIVANAPGQPTHFNQPSGLDVEEARALEGVLVPFTTEPRGWNG
jgi:hypothetical protein